MKQIESFLRAKYLELKSIYNGFLAGEEDDLELLIPYFPYDWCLVDEDGYELNLSHGKGLFAITFIHRKKKMMAFELIDPTKSEKEISDFIKIIMCIRFLARNHILYSQP